MTDIVVGGVGMHPFGRFEGMTSKVVDEVEREYLEITYAENDKLFVPVAQK